MVSICSHLATFESDMFKSEHQKQPSKPATCRPNDRLGMPGKLRSRGICGDCIPTFQRHHVVVGVQDHLSRRKMMELETFLVGFQSFT